MAENKNITIKQYNGVDYDTLYPKTTVEQIDGLSNSYFTKNQILTSLTANQFGLSSNAVPDDVLSFLGKYNEYWWERIAAGTTEYVHSTNRNAYPDSGTQDGYTYTYLGVPFENAVTAPKIASGTYVGTGTYGVDDPNKLAFDFDPKWMQIWYTNEDTRASGVSMMFLFASSNYARLAGSGNSYGNIVTWGNKSVSWYQSSSASNQCNSADFTYHWIAIG